MRAGGSIQIPTWDKARGRDAYHASQLIPPASLGGPLLVTVVELGPSGAVKHAVEFFERLPR